MNFHSQNLDERPGDHRGATGSKWRHGRGWLYFGRGDRLRLRAEWNLLRKTRSGSHVSIGADRSEGRVSLSFSFLFVALYLSFAGLPRRLFRKCADYGGRELSLRFFDAAFWWTLWADPMGGWPCPQGRWRTGSFHVVDALLGKTTYHAELLDTKSSVVAMPEGAYPCTVTLNRVWWTRPRWPFHLKQHVGANVEMGVPIPHKGKGENRWDCGEDASYGLSCTADTIEDAVTQMARHVLRDRRRYGGEYGLKLAPRAEAAV